MLFSEKRVWVLFLHIFVRVFVFFFRLFFKSQVYIIFGRVFFILLSFAFDNFDVVAVSDEYCAIIFQFLFTSG